jgi:hypothetical protein
MELEQQAATSEVLQIISSCPAIAIEGQGNNPVLNVIAVSLYPEKRLLLFVDVRHNRGTAG